MERNATQTSGTTRHEFSRCCLLAHDPSEERVLIEHAIAGFGSSLHHGSVPNGDDTLPNGGVARGAQVAALAHQIAVEDCDWCVAFGGDGTINLAVNAIYRSGRRLPLVIIPGGTGNDFVRNFLSSDVPLEVTEAESHFRFRGVDLAELRLDGGEAFVFANMLTLGNGAEKSVSIDADVKARWGTLVYVIQFWKSVSDIQTFEAVIETDLGERSIEVSDLFLANGLTCGGGYCVAPSARVDDGVLHLIAIRTGTMLQQLDLAREFFAGGHLTHELVYHETVTSVQVRLNQPQRLTIDGEPLEATEITARVLPGYQPILVCPLDGLRYLGNAVDRWRG